MGGATGPGDDDLGSGQRPAHRELDPGPEPGRVGVEADELTGRRPGDDLLTAPIVSASTSTVSHSPATTRLYGAVTPRPSQSGPRAARTASSTASGSSSSRT